MVAKAGLGLIGISAISVGGVALTKPHLLGMDYMPEWHSLSEDNGFSGESSEYKSKYGEKYGKYLVGITNKGNANGDKHESWWEWAYRRWKKEKNNSGKGKFTSIESGYGTDASKHLSQACKEAYEKTDDEFHTEVGDNTENKYTKDEIWKYCSVGQKQPQTLTDFNAGKNNSSDGKEEYTGKIGSDADKQDKLLSINSDDNKWVWDLKDKEFESANVTEKYFQAKKNDPNRKAIKKICEEAYASEAASSDEQGKPTKDDTVKYCSLEGK